MNDKTHVLLWSQSQCALHIEPIADRRMDYVPMVFGSSEECRAARLFDAASRVQRDTRTMDLFGVKA